MKIVLTGGGTAGHVTPNLALAPRLREQGFEVSYIGAKAGMEGELVRKAGIPFYGISAGKLRRYLDVRNITDIVRIKLGFFQALGVLGKIKPDIVFSKGGFVSCPVVWAARVRRIPVVLHESDITPGLANRLSMPFATEVCVAFPETLGHLKGGKGVLTGIPIRDALFSGDAAAGRSLCGFSAERPILLVIGGSQGSEIINATIRAALPELLKDFQICHLCGKDRVDAGLAAIPGYHQFEYVTEELPHLFAMTDIILSRAGATTLFEILALRKPHLLIPLSKRASRGDQILNAQSFAKQGFSKVLAEEDMTEATLVEQLRVLYRDRAQYVQAMEKSGIQNGTDEVVKVILAHSRPQ